MAALPQLPDLTPHLDGYALRWGGEEVAVFPSFLGASAGRQAAKDALAMLAACLAVAPSNTDRKAA